MEMPKIQYCKASDGVRIAYYSLGDGVPFVWIDLPYSHLQVEWRQDQEHDRLLATIAEQARIVRLDHRGFGLSDRTPPDFSLDAFVSDLEAVVDRLELPRFVLYANRGPTTPIAIEYAARHPERVQRLILFNASARMPEAMAEQMQGMLHLAKGDWRFASEGISRLVQGWEDDESSRTLAELLQASIDMHGFRRWLDEYSNWDVSDVAPQVQTPSLLTNMLGHQWFGEAHGRELAAEMPRATCFIVDGASSADRITQSVAAVQRFLNVEPGDEPKTKASELSGTAIILFADIADSTALTERLGDSAFRDKARELDDALRRAITSNGGTAIDGKLLGDGVLATFGAAREAIACAAAIHDAGTQAELAFHVGIHAGDVIREDGNIHGGAVNIASRVANEAAAGETLVSATVRELARTSAGVSFEDRGERELKGVGEPVRVFAVREN